MTIVSFTTAEFPEVVASVSYDDATLDITSVGVVNNSSKAVTCIVKKLDNPKRTYEHTWQPGDTTSFGIPAGAKFVWDSVDNNVTMTNLEIFVRHGV